MTRLKKIRTEKGLSQQEVANYLGITQQAYANYERMARQADYDTLKKLSEFFNCSIDYILGNSDKYPFPNITDDYTTFPVIGDIAAGYNHIAIENWDGEKIDIPNTYLKGHNKTEFIVLRVKGDSMYPTYQDGDKVLILKQSTVDYSGQIGAIIYENEMATLKKIEYKIGEKWIRLVPVNPSYPSIMINEDDLDTYHLIGIPKLVIREIND
ncbi:MAG: LexA family transcriptional regulator [Clostridia bacterium]|nr:LexA family transcriptional regulator [Clostridia bacterium]